MQYDIEYFMLRPTKIWNSYASSNNIVVIKHRFLIRKVFILLIMLPTVVLVACETEKPANLETNLEAIAQEIDKSLMCPICPSETIDQSQVTLAKQMKVIVREQLSDGQSREQILDYFVDRYGTGILAAPPKTGFNLLAWVVPPIILLIGGVIVTLTISSMKKNVSLVNDNTEPPTGTGLDDYFPAVDQHIRNIIHRDTIPESKANIEEAN